MRWPSAALNRRTLLIGGGAGVGLVVAFAAWPRRGGSPLRAAAGEEVFGPYLRIASDGRVTVAVPQAETGQGAWTGLAQIAADELGAAWDSVAVEPAPLAPGYANRLLGDTRLTAQSTSIRAFEAPLREAAAMARAMLVEAAAARWDVDGRTIARRKAGSSSTARAGSASASLPKRRPRPARRRRRRCARGVLAGIRCPRLDLPAKSDGSLRFAGDVRLARTALRLAPARPAGWPRHRLRPRRRAKQWRADRRPRTAGSPRSPRRRGPRAARSTPPRRASPAPPRPTRQRSSGHWSPRSTRRWKACSSKAIMTPRSRAGARSRRPTRSRRPRISRSSRRR